VTNHFLAGGIGLVDAATGNEQELRTWVVGQGPQYRIFEVGDFGKVKLAIETYDDDTLAGLHIRTDADITPGPSRKRPRIATRGFMLRIKNKIDAWPVIRL
jgi:hypothetical protein